MDSKRLNICPAGLKVAVLRKDKSEGHFPKDSKWMFLSNVLYE